MSRSFGLVDGKVFEADFFLQKLLEANGDFFAARCYFSAFVSAARSITFCLQAVMSHIDGFAEWYAVKQNALREDNIARFFVRARNELQKIGINPLNSGHAFLNEKGSPKVEFYFSTFDGDIAPDAPSIDVVSACIHYLSKLIEIVFDCYCDFGCTIDPDQYYTLENLRRMGLTIEDVEEEMGLPRGWTYTGPGLEGERLRLLRRSIPGTEIDAMFLKYISKTRMIDRGEID